MLLTEHIVLILKAIIVGTIARIITLKEDNRQCPSYPSGYVINIIADFVAAALGALQFRL